MCSWLLVRRRKSVGFATYFEGVRVPASRRLERNSQVAGCCWFCGYVDKWWKSRNPKALTRPGNVDNYVDNLPEVYDHISYTTGVPVPLGGGVIRTQIMGV